MSPPAPLGLGVVGCGAAAQSIHLAAIASLPDRFRVRHCMDPDRAVAEAVAGRVGATASTDLDRLLGDPAVDVVVIASPGWAHAEQVTAACRAGKRAVLSEKPLAESVADTERIAAVSAATGVPVLVGTMHRFDPALRALESAWGDLPAGARLVRSDALVPPNDWLVEAVTEPAPPSTATPRSSSASTDPAPPFELLMFAGLMWGLAVHHLPLIRMVVPDLDRVEVTTAAPAGAAGYVVSMRAGDTVIQMVSMLNHHSHTDWSFTVQGDGGRARVDFPPGYIPTRSATATLSRPGSGGGVSEQRFGAIGETGYRAQYRHLYDVARGDAEPLTPAAGAVADARLMERLIAAAHDQWFGVASTGAPA